MVSTQITSGLKRWKSNDFNISKSNPLKPKPKFISLYSAGENKCGPVFLKQKINEIKIKYIDVPICEDEYCICKKKKLNELENNLKCAVFDPNQGISFY